MSKLKISLSALLMLVLLSMFGAFASAQGVTLPSNVGTVDNFGNSNTHKTHGNFQNNTNSCANCHSTHNGEDDMLLMKSGQKELCLSCHDGTMGFYNVTTASEAGVIDSHEQSASMHNVDSDLALSAAPGALANKSTATFECSSCHNPHGSANDRLLNETVAGKQYGNNYNVTIVGYTETITKLNQVPIGQKAIKLNLVEDPAFADINNATGLSGLKIYKSNGIYNKTTDAPGLTQAQVYDYKLNYSEFCASCHDDYMKNRENGPRAAKTAEGHALFTHTTNSTKQGRSCTACHYAHGTDITLLKDTAGKTIADLEKPVADGGKGWTDAQARAYMKDVSKSGSSSLKRFTNMAVCWACHQSTHQIANTPGTTNYPNTTDYKNYLVPGGDYSGKSLIK
ncbi:cytochrome c3 family protein [Neobacillus drentensis]|uniref:cytochrome c3 family protein n=1 Tax=Neobacillus drentensis TaxID=220684 RepID=UPI002FFE0FAB